MTVFFHFHLQLCNNSNNAGNGWIIAIYKKSNIHDSTAHIIQDFQDSYNTSIKPIFRPYAMIKTG